MLGCPKVISIKERKMFTSIPKMTQMIYGKRTNSSTILKGSHYVSPRYQFTPFLLRSALLPLPMETVHHPQCRKPYSLSIAVGLILQPICFMKSGHVRVTMIPFPKCICKKKSDLFTQKYHEDGGLGWELGAEARQHWVGFCTETNPTSCSYVKQLSDQAHFPVPMINHPETKQA